MMDTAHPRHPSFGFRWEFQPGQDFSLAASLERRGFSHWSLRLETFLKYGGPLANFLEERSRHGPLRFFSDELPWAPAREWDMVHAMASVALLEKTAPLRLSCYRPLPEVPQPRTILEELFQRLPVSVDLSLLARDEDELDMVRRTGPIAATVHLEDWREEWENLHAAADLVAEVVIDPLSELMSPHVVAQALHGVLLHSRSNEILDISFVMPPRMSQMPLAIKRAEEVRGQLMNEGWKK